jgi:hypothetical protein
VQLGAFSEHISKAETPGVEDQTPGVVSLLYSPVDRQGGGGGGMRCEREGKGGGAEVEVEVEVVGVDAHGSIGLAGESWF